MQRMLKAVRHDPDATVLDGYEIPQEAGQAPADPQMDYPAEPSESKPLESPSI